MEKMNDKNIIDCELLIYFYQTSFICLILIELKNFIILEEELNISSFFAFITIFYIIGQIHSTIGDNYTDIKRYTRSFYVCFLSCFLSTFLAYNFNLLNQLNVDFSYIKIDQENIMKTVNDRINKILETSGNHDSIKEAAKYSNNFIIFLYFSIFAFAFAVVFEISKKEALLDDLLITNVEKNNSLLNYTIQNQTFEKLREEELSNLKNKSIVQEESLNPQKETSLSETELEKQTLTQIGVICKAKIIIRIVLTILLFDQLLKDFLLQNAYCSELSFRLILVPVFIILDTALTASCLRYHCMNYLLGNYFVMLEAVENPKKISLEMIRNHCLYSNKNFWKFFSNLFINAFMPIMVYFTFLHRADIVSKLRNNKNLNFENFVFFTGFMETILYLVYTGFILSRCVISVSLFCYYQIIVKNKKSKVL